MTLNRVWAMPNKNTFDIKQIKETINKYNEGGIISIDPFANKNRLARFCNDLDPQYNTEFNLDALDFLKTFEDSSVDLVLFDPPYSPRQVSECYKNLDKTVNSKTTSSKFWSDLKREISRIAKPNSIVISCGWNSGGVGKKYGFKIEEILLVAHGGWHNDTIVTVETKEVTSDGNQYSF